MLPSKEDVAKDFLRPAPLVLHEAPKHDPHLHVREQRGQQCSFSIVGLDVFHHCLTGLGVSAVYDLTPKELGVP
jgi:hypothetical protein